IGASVRCGSAGGWTRRTSRSRASGAICIVRWISRARQLTFCSRSTAIKGPAPLFLKKAIRRNGPPEKITIDGSDANEAAIKSYNETHGTAIIIRQVKYLNNIVEQDHRGVKRVTRPMLGFKSFEAAQDTLVGIELMHMIKKKQMVLEAGDEG